MNNSIHDEKKVQAVRHAIEAAPNKTEAAKMVGMTLNEIIKFNKDMIRAGMKPIWPIAVREDYKPKRDPEKIWRESGVCFA